MFYFKFMTLTQLGKIFGVTNQQVGKWLVEIGLRTTENKPSHEAFQGEFVEQVPSRNDKYTWGWHSAKTVAVLEAAGHFRILNPPEDLVKPPMLNGPFAIRGGGDGTYQIVSADGCVAIVVTGKRNAEYVLRMLTLLHQTGSLEKHFGALTA
jgi:hypothetical protein